jgi:hypothetical protein
MGVPNGGGGRLNIGEAAMAAAHGLAAAAGIAAGAAAEMAGDGALYMEGGGWLHEIAVTSVLDMDGAAAAGGLLPPLTAQCCRSSS